jgi:hypothetical protein
VILVSWVTSVMESSRTNNVWNEIK